MSFERPTTRVTYIGRKNDNQSDSELAGTIIHDSSLTRLAQWLFSFPQRTFMIRKLKSGEYRLYSRKKNPKTNKRRNLGTFSSLADAKKHEQEIQYFKRH
jgi:hypothetical protein